MQFLAMSEEAYFGMLANSDLKYEYLDGIAYAMAGAQPPHVRIETNIIGELFQKLRGKGCLPNTSNQAVKLAGDRGYMFPDVTVHWGEPEYAITNGIGCLTNPVVIVEVLSPSTASWVENEKLAAYTGIRSLREYLIVSSHRRWAKLYFRRSAQEIWGVRMFEAPTDRIDFESCGCALKLAEIYATVELN